MVANLRIKTIHKQPADFTYFDHKFFGFTEKQAELMDPQLRWLFETVYESIFDSGFNPAELKGSKTGVFIGTTTSGNPQPNSDGYMKYSSEISRYYEFNGPFFTYDTTQSSGLIALEKAIIRFVMVYAIKLLLVVSTLIMVVNSRTMVQLVLFLFKNQMFQEDFMQKY